MTDLEITKRRRGPRSNAEKAAIAAAAASAARIPPDGQSASKATRHESPDQARARADARLREIRGQANASGADRDKYWAPKPPDGWTYEWKTRSVLGKEDSSYAVELIRSGWTPVPLSRHPDMMPPGWKGEVIEVGGQWLMERPEVLTREARLRDDSAAREAVRTKEQQLRQSGKDHLSRDGTREVALRKSFEPIAVPADE